MTEWKLNVQGLQAVLGKTRYGQLYSGTSASKNVATCDQVDFLQ